MSDERSKVVGELKGMMGVVGSGSDTSGVPRSEESRLGEPEVLEAMLEGVTWVSVGDRIGVRTTPALVTMLLTPESRDPNSLVRGNGRIPSPSDEVGEGVGVVMLVSVPVALAVAATGLLDGVSIDSTAEPAEPMSDDKGVAIGVTIDPISEVSGETTDPSSDVRPPMGVAKGVSTELRPVPSWPSSEVKPPRSPPPFDEELDVGVGGTCGAGVPGVPGVPALLLLLSIIVDRPTMMPVPVDGVTGVCTDGAPLVGWTTGTLPPPVPVDLPGVATGVETIAGF